MPKRPLRLFIYDLKVLKYFCLLLSFLLFRHRWRGKLNRHLLELNILIFRFLWCLSLIDPCKLLMQAKRLSDIVF